MMFIYITRQFKTIGCFRLDYGYVIIFYRTYMDVGNEKLFRSELDARNFEPSSKTKVGHKGKNLQSGTRQHNAKMFDHLESTDGMARRHFVTNITVKKILDA